MSRNPYLRTPPGLSTLSQELVIDDLPRRVSSPPRGPRPLNVRTPPRRSSTNRTSSYDWTPTPPPKDEFADHVPLLPYIGSASRPTSESPTPSSQSSSKPHLRPSPIPTKPYVDSHTIAYAASDSCTTSPTPSPKFKDAYGQSLGLGRPPSSGAYTLIFDNNSPSLYTSAYDPPLPIPKRPRSDTAQCSLDSPSPGFGSATSTTGFLRGSPKFARSRPFSRFSLSGQKEHPFAKDFEVPQWSKFAWHTGFCGLAYPVLLLFVRLAQDRTLFWARLFTGVGCGVIGLILGISLLKLARGILEAATWATVIHQSRVPEGAGVRLKDLAAQSDDHASALTALKLIWDRRNYHGASREYRKFYDARPWSLWIILFLVNVIAAGVLPFVLARFVDIDVHIVHQYQKYYEIAIKGDLSEADIERASNLQAVFENYALTWTLAPFSVHGGLPPVVTFQYGNDTVYFSEVILSQFLPNGSGFGTFETDTTLPSIDLDTHRTSQSQPDSGHDHHEDQEPADWLERGLEQFSPPVELEPGSLIKFPRWGIRIKCAKIPDQQVNIIPLSENNRTYVFTPRDALTPLFAGFAMNFPEILKAPFNFSAAMHENDTVPAVLRASNISLGAMFWDNGVAHSMKSTPLNMGMHPYFIPHPILKIIRSGAGEVGTGFVTVENILVRLNTTYAPHGKFDVLGPYPLPNEDGNMTYIGYDAAVCVELYEPWVLEVYNSSAGAPATVRIRDAIGTLRDLESEEMQGERITDPLVSRGLNSSHMWPAYVAGHQNSVNQIIKDNGRDFYYVPSPTLISFAGGQDPFSYTELSTAYYAKARALADAGNVLPYFVGSGMSVARQYHDRQSTTAVVNKLYTLLAFLVVFLMGAISAFFVPRLPLDIPRRGFDLYSWMTAFQAQELVSERTSVFGKSMDLRDIKEHAGEIRFRYAG
ncbi:hypothetical protein NLJ89_g5402 [Agrocybe chaxingu]|uniref:Uncharacterized protein n=1 Tax=Agrocybe chaxingu TaxID=84603 RepID=A0A9W8MTM5_9AGAR|nr:hypothetical protein NLJ89_g5402 [Agrocybe chaxingu]